LGLAVFCILASWLVLMVLALPRTGVHGKKSNNWVRCALVTMWKLGPTPASIGAHEDTVIENGVKLDNLIQIGHNVHIGAHTAMAGCVGVAGSARIGAHCTVGGGAVVLGHLSLADHVHISAASVVTRSITQPGHYTGMFPLDSNANWEKNAASLKQLSRLRDRIKALEADSQNDKEP